MGLGVPIHWFGLQFSDEQFDPASGLSEELNELTAEGIQTYDGVNHTISKEDFIIKAPVTRTGYTQVIVTSTGALREPSIRLAYNIKAFVLGNALVTPGTLARAGEDHDRQILSFLKKVKEALGIVQHTVPEAEPLSAKLHGAVHPVKTPIPLSQIQCMFRTQATYAKLHSTSWGDWAQLEFFEGILVGVAAFRIEGTGSAGIKASVLWRYTGLISS
ncbi:MAG: hypothetical protein Q9196_001174 [Gyalolechia fulgens]